LASVVEVFEGLSFFHYHASGVEICDTLFDSIQRQIEVYDNTICAEKGHYLFGIDNRTAGSDDGVFDVDAGNIFFFDLTESFEALGIDDLLQGFVEYGLDKNIGIEEVA